VNAAIGRGGDLGVCAVCWPRHFATARPALRPGTPTIPTVFAAEPGITTSWFLRRWCGPVPDRSSQAIGSWLGGRPALGVIHRDQVDLLRCWVPSLAVAAGAAPRAGPVGGALGLDRRMVASALVFCEPTKLPAGFHRIVLRALWGAAAEPVAPSGGAPSGAAREAGTTLFFCSRPLRCWRS